MTIDSFINITLSQVTQTGVDSMNIKNYQENWYQQIVDFGRNYPWVLLIGMIYPILTLVDYTNTQGLLPLELNISVIQFGFSLSSLFLLLSIGLFLLSHGYRPIWGMSFLIYAFSFLGLCLRALNFPFTDINNPFILHLWLLPLVFFISGMWIATSSLFDENKKITYLPALGILLLGESWFLIGLAIFRDVELISFGISFGLFIPMLIGLGYIWYRFGRDSIFASPSFLAIGFSLMGLIHFLWSPWQTEILGQIYYILFTVYIISLVLLFVGFRVLTKDLNKI